jgi:5'-3' exonuclease
MGIKNLHQFLRKKCSEAYSKISLSELQYKKISIDVSLYLFKYKAAVGDRWLNAFINLIIALRKNHVHCYFVFDGPSPKEKEMEKERRRANTQKLEDRSCEIEFAINKYRTSGEIIPILLETMKRRKSPPMVKKLLRRKNDNGIDIIWLEKYLERIKGQVVRMTSEDLRKVAKLFTLLGIPHTVSKGEAETLCAHLSRDGVVHGALSEDTDLLPCGCKYFLHKINIKGETCEVVEISKVLEILELTFDEFQDFCILCGTDYNSNIRMVGPHGAYKLIKEYRNISKFPDTIDTSAIDHVRVKEIFSTYPEDLPPVDFCSTPDWDNLPEFLFKINCGNSLPALKRNLNNQEIIFVE